MRGSRLSCVLCTLLSLFMVMPASVASAATDESGGSGEVTIHYYDSAGWAKPFAYMYGDGVSAFCPKQSTPSSKFDKIFDSHYNIGVYEKVGMS